jgi:hypothetical protein
MKLTKRKIKKNSEKSSRVKELGCGWSFSLKDPLYFKEEDEQGELMEFSFPREFEVSCVGLEDVDVLAAALDGCNGELSIAEEAAVWEYRIVSLDEVA